MACTLMALRIILTLLERLSYRSARLHWAVGLMTKEIRSMGLDELRERLDIIDHQMMLLLSERAKVITKVADFKRQHNIPVYIPEREAAIMVRLRSLNPGPLPDDAVERIYRTVVEEMRKFEGEGTVPEPRRT